MTSPVFKTKEEWDKTFEKQRRDRLQESVDEYLLDGDTDAQVFFDDLLFCVNEIAEYHGKALDRADKAKNLITNYGNS